MIGRASFRRGRHAHRLMNPAEVVIHKVQCQSVLVILELFENPLVSRVNCRIVISKIKIQTDPLPCCGFARHDKRLR
jgi:hypothetical protein